MALILINFNKVFAFLRIIMEVLKYVKVYWYCFIQNFKHANFISSTIYLSFWSPILKLCVQNKKQG